MADEIRVRVDYTGEDDDFLCRYLAAHHPSGSWHSRKTYENLVSCTYIAGARTDAKTASAPEYPIAARHSSQSWHERFKKGSALLSKRVVRFVQQGVNDTLKTKEERAKAKELKEAKEAQEKAQEKALEKAQEKAQGKAQETAPNGGDLGQPLHGDHQTAAQREGARLTEIATK